MPRRFSTAGLCLPDWQTGKTTVLHALAAQLTGSGRYAALHLPPELHPPAFPAAPNSSLLSTALTAWRNVTVLRV